MSDCVKLKGCPFFNDKMDNMPLLANMYKKNYCKGDFQSCARWIVSETVGKEKVPLDLFPNQADRAKGIIEKG
jgi:hypothetical protein